jgi:tetratricopeptide (TPR) repeat protein
MTRVFPLLLSFLLGMAATAAARPPRPADPSPAELIAAGRIDDAVRMLRARTAASPNDHQAFHLLARAYYAEERWDDAVHASERAIALQPDNSNYHMWLGRADGEKAEHSNFFTAARMVGRIRREFERAVELDGSNVEARSNLAEFYIEAPSFMGGSPDKARIQAEKIAALNPPNSMWVLARLAEENHNQEEAERFYRAAIEASHGSANTWIDLASFFRRAKRYPEMEKAIQQALAAEHKRSTDLYDAASLLARAGRDFPLAIQLLRQYLGSSAPTEDAPVIQAHYLLGTVLEKQGDKDGARAEYQAALALAADYKAAKEALQHLRP